MLTNNYSLPKVLYEAIKKGFYDRPKDAEGFSVTQLISPVYQARLIHEYHDQIVEDASDQLWALLGSAVHAVIEKGAAPGSIQELRLSIPIDGVEVSGKWDLLEVREKSLSDFKVTSKYAVKYGKAKEEWVQQLNILKYIAELNGFQIEKLTIHAILRDFMATDALKHDYPDVPFMSIPVEVWDTQRVKTFLEGRVAAFRAAWAQSPIFMEVCSLKERWNVTTYRVYKDQQSARAINGGVVYSLEEAQALLNVPGRHMTITSVDKRCENYCSVKQFCKHGRTL